MQTSVMIPSISYVENGERLISPAAFDFWRAAQTFSKTGSWALSIRCVEELIMVPAKGVSGRQKGKRRCRTLINHPNPQLVDSNNRPGLLDTWQGAMYSSSYNLSLAPAAYFCVWNAWI